MTPVEIAAQLRGEHFQEELEAHLLRGFVFSTPDAFLMARPAPKGADVSDVWQTWPREECNAWFVWVGVGSAIRLFNMIPYDLPWIGWHRQGRGWQRNHWIRSRQLQFRHLRTTQLSSP